MIRWILEADRTIFYLINKKLSFSWLDNIMLLLREALTWIPLYLFFLLFFYSNCRRYLLSIVSLSLLTFAITDFLSAGILKPFIARLRPCHDMNLGFTLNNIAGCGGVFGMPSSHASNHFGLATFWYIVIAHTLEMKWVWLFVWAFAICYAQVYVGVHFPTDVLAGALVGTLVGFGTGTLYKRRVSDTLNSIESA